MSSSKLMELVGNDANKVNELVSVVAEMICSYLSDVRKEEQIHDESITENFSRASQTISNNIYTPVNSNTKTARAIDRRGMAPVSTDVRGGGGGAVKRVRLKI